MLAVVTLLVARVRTLALATCPSAFLSKKDDRGVGPGQSERSWDQLPPRFGGVAGGDFPGGAELSWNRKSAVVGRKAMFGRKPPPAFLVIGPAPKGNGHNYKIFFPESLAEHFLLWLR